MGANMLLGRGRSSLNLVVPGAGTAGVVCTNLLLDIIGVSDTTVRDLRGILHNKCDDMNCVKFDLTQCTNSGGFTGDRAEVLAGAAVFFGVSAVLVPRRIAYRDGT